MTHMKKNTGEAKHFSCVFRSNGIRI